jgi:hypothetical protein
MRPRGSARELPGAQTQQSLLDGQTSAGCTADCSMCPSRWSASCRSAIVAKSLRSRNLTKRRRLQVAVQQTFGRPGGPALVWAEGERIGKTAAAGDSSLQWDMTLAAEPAGAAPGPTTPRSGGEPIAGVDSWQL